MEPLRRTSVILLIVAILHEAPSSSALDAHKVLHIPEKIIGGVIDMVQNHKNKPSQQATFQQSLQTQTTFSQQGNPQGTPPAITPQQPWTGQGAGFQGQAQFQAQGQFGNYGSHGSGGNYQAAPVASLYPINTGTGTSGQYSVNTGPYQQQQGFSQTQNQGQYQNYQNQGQFQNQQSNFQGQGQNQGQNQNGQYQSGQYGSGNIQGTGHYVQPSGGNYQGQNVGQTTGNYQGQNVGQTTGNYQGQNVGQSSGNYQGQNVGQTSVGNYQGQNVGQTSGGHYQGQNSQTSGNYQSTQTGQYPGNPNSQYNQNQQVGQSTQSGQNQQSGYYQGSQQTSGQSGQTSSGTSGSQTGSYGGSQYGGFLTSSSHQSGGSAPTCLCQAWTKPPEPQVLHDEPPKPEKIEKKANEKKPAA